MRLQQGLTHPIEGNELVAKLAQQRGILPQQPQGPQPGFQDEYYGPESYPPGYGEQPQIDPQFLQQMVAEQVHQAVGPAMMQAQEKIQFDNAVSAGTQGMPPMARAAIHNAAQQYQRQNPYSTYEAAVEQAKNQWNAQVMPTMQQQQAEPNVETPPAGGGLPGGTPPPEQGPAPANFAEAMEASRTGLST